MFRIQLAGYQAGVRQVDWCRLSSTRAGEIANSLHEVTIAPGLKGAAVRHDPACSMQAEVGIGLVMMAPARGSSKYVLVRGGALRWFSRGGAGSNAAGALTMRLIIGRS